MGFCVFEMYIIRRVEYHLGRHGEAQNRFEEVFKQLILQIPDLVWCSKTNPTLKFLNDRHIKLISDHWTTTRENHATSGIV